MTNFDWDPDSYLQLVAEEIPDYEQLQEALLAVTQECSPESVLELGVGSGETARRVLGMHSRARLVGIDGNSAMLAAASNALPPHALLHHQQLEDPLPAGPFDLVTSALTVHHLDGAAKADLFTRVRGALSPRGRFALADLVIPERGEDIVTPVDGVEDQPSSVGDQLDWLRAAGFSAAVRWQRRDLAVLAADAP